jgi:uncharacterized protein (TIGR02284 family)
VSDGATENNYQDIREDLAVVKVTSKPDAMETLSDLILVCRNAERGFRRAMETARLAEIKRLFDMYAKQRARFALQLETEVVRLGGLIPTENGIGNKSRVKSAVTDDGSVVAACTHMEEDCMRAYREALANDLPLPLHTVVERQNAALVAALGRIRELQSSCRTVA